MQATPAPSPQRAHRIHAVVGQDGTLTLDRLPFQAGEAVEIIILTDAESPHDVHPNVPPPTMHYDRPFEPAVDADEWDAARSRS